MDSQVPQAHSSFIRGFFFWTGIVSTIAYRIIVFLNGYDPIWVQIAWYTGTVGFIIYFAHRYQISEKRAALIKNGQLDTKIDQMPELSDQDRQAMRYIFSTLKSTREKWNYIFIFVASFIALILGLYVDFFVR